MVLAELGGRIAGAIRHMNDATVMDEKVLNECLNEITRALLTADVQFSIVRAMQNNIKNIVNLEHLAAGHNKRKIFQQAIFDELCKMLDSGKPPYTPTKGKPSIVMFVGLQGTGKTTTCTKYANYYKKKGWKPALVCADTFRAGAYDQLKQNATKSGIPFYGSYTETDPAKIAIEGVETFKKEKCDLIIVDTSGRHRQKEDLFAEMHQIFEVTKPDLVIFVMDGSIGQAALDQVKAFKETVPIGAIIVTKLDGHAKGGGALSAVAATKSPVIFIGTGEHVHEFEVFNVKSFVSRLLGIVDLKGFVDKIHEVIPKEKQTDLMERMMSQGKPSFTLRMMYEMFHDILNNGSTSEALSMIPGFAKVIPEGGGKERMVKFKDYMVMMDSMTNKELDSTDIQKVMNESRMMRIARGSGKKVGDVEKMLKMHKQLNKMIGQFQKMSGRSQTVPPQMLWQIGAAMGAGVGNIQNLLKQMSGPAKRRKT